jgi:two-component system, NtrC family, sensor kinase
MTTSSEQELAAFKFLDHLYAHLRAVREPQNALRYVLRETQEFFHASHACIASLQPGRPKAEILFNIPKGAYWDLDHLTGFIRHSHPPVHDDLVLAPLRRRKGAWGAMALSRSRSPFDHRERRLFTRIAAALTDAIHQIDADRLLGVRDGIDRKIMEQIDPKDLFYQILHGLRSLTHYDHSSALLIREENESELVVVAEQIAWTKAKSERIGLRMPLATELAALLVSEQSYGFDRVGERWHEWNGRPAAGLAALLDYNNGRAGETDTLREGSMLCAPLVTRDGLIGVLKIAARFPAQLKPYDAELVEHFRAHAAVAIQNLHRTTSLRARVVTAERKHAMAELARSVSHDVNNALGSMLPLVQQMQADLRSGRHDPVVLSEDLEHLQKSLQVCRRIFGGMLAYSRGAARGTQHGYVRRAFDTASAILKFGIGRRGIELYAEIPDDAPAVACGQSDLEQVFLNVLTNAREATPAGGKITVAVEPSTDALRVTILDTGSGILPENLPRVLEPFFTTKPHGNGLGLPICRTILWEIGGTIGIESQPGLGTRVDLTFPQARWQSAAPTS